MLRKGGSRAKKNSSAQNNRDWTVSQVKALCGGHCRMRPLGELKNKLGLRGERVDLGGKQPGVQRTGGRKWVREKGTMEN